MNVQSRSPEERDYVDGLVREFAYRGFTTMPLTLWQMRWCASHVSADVAYAIGCDVAAGVPFADCMAFAS